MTRIHTPATVADAPASTHASLKAVEKQLGVVPNLFRVVANSPAALTGYLQLNAASSDGALDGATRERIALVVAEINGCGYCLSAHTYLGRKVAKLDDAEITANRNGASNDPMADAAVRFAAALVRQRGKVSNEQVEAVRSAGYSDAQVLDIVLAVALNTFTNYVNEVALTEIDFPMVQPLRLAA
ncbi:MAG: peroxidase-related enzyme [Silanimonas sp.]|nr:peroxidase-related enzyme [Silanimonas sp.]